MSGRFQRRFPIGAETIAGGVHFRVWAPKRRRVEVILERSGAVELEAEEKGYFSGFAAGACHGMGYRFRLDRGEGLFPDPASRFQPEGPHGASQIVDAAVYNWRDQAWKGVRIEGQVVYEMHIGTFTAAGTWKAARELLPELADTGITLLEIMPVADFVGNFGWGYDGVDFYAPTRLYGTPDDLRDFVDHAHGLGLGVILDVVYNHFGPDGNYLKEFSESYFTKRHANDWGEAIDFDGPDSAPVREFVITNACYWIDEFHMDGLRLDATQQIFDDSSEHILASLSREVQRTAGRRSVVLIAENEPQEARLARPRQEGGCGLHALWNDDFHHSARVAMTGQNEAYYTDYAGTPQELISALKWGFLYQGQYYAWQEKRRGSYALDLSPSSFVTFLENHDQIANSAYGQRVHEMTTPGRYKALMALTLLGPGTPMLFQGQEYGASTPFLYFADHHTELALLVQQGRLEFLSQFPSIGHSQTEFVMGKPQERTTFEKCKLDHSERKRNPHTVALHKDLLKLRREDPVFRAQRSDWMHGVVLGPDAFALRFFGGEHGDRLMLVNLGREFRLKPASQPLLAEPGKGSWQMLWSSEDPRYQGSAREPLTKDGMWNIQGHCAVVMHER